jgi:hypothetical protein
MLRPQVTGTHTTLDGWRQVCIDTGLLARTADGKCCPTTRPPGSRTTSATLIVTGRITVDFNTVRVVEL